MRANFSPARNVRSTTAPLSRLFSFVRTKAPPLPGFTCWNSTMRERAPSTSMCIPFGNWLVEIVSAITTPQGPDVGAGLARPWARQASPLRHRDQLLAELRQALAAVLRDEAEI